jgi:hypothetical protein
MEGLGEPNLSQDVPKVDLHRLEDSAGRSHALGETLRDPAGMRPRPAGGRHLVGVTLRAILPQPVVPAGGPFSGRLGAKRGRVCDDASAAERGNQVIGVGYDPDRMRIVD